MKLLESKVCFNKVCLSNFLSWVTGATLSLWYRKLLLKEVYDSSILWEGSAEAVRGVQRRPLPVSVLSQMPSSQNNRYATVVYFGPFVSKRSHRHHDIYS